MNETKNKKISTAEKAIDIVSGVIDWVFIVFFLAIFLFAMYAIYDSGKVYEESSLPKAVQESVEIAEDGTRKIDFDALKAQNSDVIGWIVLDDTPIDYPIMYYKNNNYYLSRDFNKEYVGSGSIFADYRNSNDWSDDYTLVYGHNVNGDKMFGPLNHFHETEYFAAHKTGKLYTPDGNYSLEIVGERVTDKDDKNIYNVSALKNNLTVVKEYAKTADQKREEGIDSATKIVALTTCRGMTNMRQIIYLKATKD